MASLDSAQLIGLIDALAELHALGPATEFPTRALTVVERVIGADTASYNEVDVATGANRVVPMPDEIATQASLDAFAAHLHEHPVIAHYAATGDTRAHAISDFLGRRDLHRLGLYAEVFAPLGIEDQLATTMLATEGPTVIGVALNRGRIGFSGTDRLLLDLLGPHIRTAYTNSLLYSAALAGAQSDPARSAAAAAALERLTDRQREVLALVSLGHTNQQIAYRLGITVGTTKKHVENILERLDVHTRVAAAGQFLVASGSEDATAQL
jgi:DNA-binding CsgD family transcriptional regulator